MHARASCQYSLNVIMAVPLRWNLPATKSSDTFIADIWLLSIVFPYDQPRPATIGRASRRMADGKQMESGGDGESKMSFKEELANRRARKAKMAKQETRHREEQLAKIEGRASELAQHLTQQGANVGLVVQNQNGRVTLSHSQSKEQITIDADPVRYSLLRNQPHVGGRRTLENTHQSVEKVDEIDTYVLDWLERIGAFW
jgi:hypothetical protein